MNEKNELITGKVGKTLIFFAIPYLLSSFMQTFYGMADLFITGLYNGSATITAVSVGSQVMHMLTVILLGFAMGTTVRIGRAVGAGDKRAAAQTMGTTGVFFMGFACVLTAVLFVMTKGITRIILVPADAAKETVTYLRICFLGIPFITAYNVISSLFRGTGDSRSPMYFVAVACVVNIVLDFLFIGVWDMGAAGAALGTILGQGVSVAGALVMLKRKDFGFAMNRQAMRPNRQILSDILNVGAPIALQDGLIQVAFMVITVIANSRGLIAAASVGIVEKLIGFMFLVPSSFLSAISAVTAQNMGAGKPERARQSLYYGLMITVGWGVLCSVYNQFLPQTLIGLFTQEEQVLAAGCDYMRAYCFDTIFAGIHFCFSGYFCGDQKSGISFLHNIIAILTMRIPGAYAASRLFLETLYPMGWAAPLGSLISAAICVGFYVHFRREEKR